LPTWKGEEQRGNFEKNSEGRKIDVKSKVPTGQKKEQRPEKNTSPNKKRGCYQQWGMARGAPFRF